MPDKEGNSSRSDEKVFSPTRKILRNYLTRRAFFPYVTGHKFFYNVLPFIKLILILPDSIISFFLSILTIFFPNYAGHFFVLLNLSWSIRFFFNLFSNQSEQILYYWICPNQLDFYFKFLNYFNSLLLIKLGIILCYWFCPHQLVFILIFSLFFSYWIIWSSVFLCYWFCPYQLFFF